MNGVSLFCSAGIGELLMPSNINIVCANELLKQRADCYSFWHPETKVLSGDICDPFVQEEIIKTAKEKHAKFFLATPPCQGVSTLGKNKVQQHYINDKRNFLIMEALNIFEACDFDYGLIENVPQFLDMLFPFKNTLLPLTAILKEKFGSHFEIEAKVLNAEDYGGPQSRPRAIIKIFKKGLVWDWPIKQRKITLFEAIGHLPSLEPGEVSSIPWHSAKTVSPLIAEALRHTKPGTSAMANPVYYPKKKDGTRIKGFHNTYKRMVWDEPCPARTMYNGSVSSHNNVHPGRIQPDGTYSDPRPLSLRETFIVSTIPLNIRFPEWARETFIRTVVGEAIPPLLLRRIVEKIGG